MLGDWTQAPGRLQDSLDSLLRDPPPGALGPACLSLLRVIVAKHAPENLGMLPERWPFEAAPERPRSLREQLAALPAPTPPAPTPNPPRGQLTAAQLAQVRAEPTGWVPPWSRTP